MKNVRPGFACAALFAAVVLLFANQVWFLGRHAPLTAPAVEKIVPIAISIAVDGSISVEGRLVEIDGLRSILRAQVYPRPVIIRAQKEHASYQALNDVLDACGKLGVTQVGLASQR